MILMWKFLYFRTSAAEGTYWGRDPRDIQLSALCPHTQCTSTWTWQKFQPKFGERALGNCVNVIPKELPIAIGAGIAMWRIQNICNKMFLFFGFLWHDCKNCFKNFCQILNEGHGMIWKMGNAAFSQIHTVRYIQYEVRPILQGEKRQIFDIFLFSTRFHICSQAFDMIWFHPSTLTQQHKSLVKIRKSAKRNQNLTLVASLNQLWRNRPVKESVWFFMCYMTSYLTLLLVGIPHPSFQPAISFQTFCLGKKSAFFNVWHHAWLRRRWSEHPILVLSPLLKLMAHRCKGFLGQKIILLLLLPSSYEGLPGWPASAGGKYLFCFSSPSTRNDVIFAAGLTFDIGLFHFFVFLPLLCDIQLLVMWHLVMWHLVMTPPTLVGIPHSGFLSPPLDPRNPHTGRSRNKAWCNRLD